MNLNTKVIRIFRDPFSDLTEDVLSKYTSHYSERTVNKYSNFQYWLVNYEDIEYIIKIKDFLFSGNIISPPEMYGDYCDNPDIWVRKYLYIGEKLKKQWDF